MIPDRLVGDGSAFDGRGRVPQAAEHDVVAAGMLLGVVKVSLADGAKPDLGRTVAVAGGGQMLGEIGERPPGHGEQNRVDVGEVCVDRRGADADDSRQPAQGEPVGAALVDDGQGGRHDLVPEPGPRTPRVPRPSGRSRHGGHHIKMT